MRKENLEFKFTELSDVYNKDKKNDISIVLDIRSVNKEPYSLSPAFDSDIERYCWVPEKNNTQLNLDFFVKDGTKIYIDNELLDEKTGRNKIGNIRITAPITVNSILPTPISVTVNAK